MTSIGDGAFSKCSSLSSVIIGNGVQSIGEYAFKECRSLESLTIGNDVQSIGRIAFEGCSSLNSIELNNDYVVSKFSSVFSDIKNNITSVAIGNSVQSIGDSAFEHCESLISVTIGNGLTSIGNRAFVGCHSLESVDIPDSVTSIGNSAFSDCHDLTSVKISGSLTTPGSLIIPGNVTSIGREAFCECYGLTSVTIPDSVESIGSMAFVSCNNLQSINVSEGNSNYRSKNGVLFSNDDATLIQYPAGKTDTSYSIPGSVTSIGIYAFYNCSNLTSVTYNGISEPKISYGPFDGCNITSVDVPKNYKGDTFCGIPINKTLAPVYIATGNCGDQGENVTYTFDGETLTISGSGKMSDYSRASDTPWYSYITSIKNVVIEDGVQSIGDYAFSYCSSLTSVNIPNSVISIGDHAFRDCSRLTSVTIPGSVKLIGVAFIGCSGLQSINVSDGNANYKSIYGVLFSKDGSTIIQYPAGKTDISYSIPNGVTSIGQGAFYNCSNLTSITIPDSVKSIGQGAFYGCSNLTSVTYNGISEPEISTNAFEGCNIESVNVSTNYNGRTFGGMAVNKTDTPDKPVDPVDPDKPDTGNCGENVTYTFDRGTETLTISGSGAMSNYSNTSYAPWNGYKDSIKRVVIGDGVESIGDYAFYGCSKLISVTIGNSVQSTGKRALSNGVKSIGAHAFEGCSSLESVTIPGSVTSIGESAFGNCTSLSSVTYNGTSEPKISDSAFGGCSKLSSVNVPNDYDGEKFGDISVTPSKSGDPEKPSNPNEPNKPENPGKKGKSKAGVIAGSVIAAVVVVAAVVVTIVMYVKKLGCFGRLAKSLSEASASV